MGAVKDQAVPGVVSTTYVRLLYEYLAGQGVDPLQLLGEPPPDAADRGLGRFPMAHWRELWQPQLFDRQRLQPWQEAGGHSINARLRQRAVDLMDAHRAPPLPAAVDQEVERILTT